MVYGFERPHIFLLEQVADRVVKHTKLLGDFSGRVRDEISRLWLELQETANVRDELVIYVGSRGSERAIALATQMPAEKVFFMSCGCGIENKLELMMTADLGKVRFESCECGGQELMRLAFWIFAASGKMADISRQTVGEFVQSVIEEKG